MPAITLGFAEFEARLDRVRRRLNAQMLIGTACVVASMAMIAAAAIIISEANLAPVAAAWVRRTAIIAAGLSAAFALWRLRSRWLNLEKTARLVDHRAHMEDRVATLLANPAPDGRFPLRAILVGQIFQRSAQWGVERVAPQQLRRPTMLTAAALAVLILAVLGKPEVAENGSDATAAKTSREDHGSTEPRQLAGADGNDESTNDLSSGSESLSEGGRPDVGGGSQIGLADERTAKVPPPGAADETGDGHQDGSGDDQPGGPSREDRDGEGEDGQDRAARAGRALGRQGNPPGARIASLATPIARPPEADQLPRLGADAEHQAAAKAATKGTTNQTPPATGDQKSPDSEGGSKAGARDLKEGLGANAGGVLGDRTSPAALQLNEQAESMVIQLKSFAVNRVENYEPQGKAGDAATGAEDTPGAPATIADEQWEDSLFSRSSVTRAHQDLIRDLFTPDTQ